MRDGWEVVTHYICDPPYSYIMTCFWWWNYLTILYYKTMTWKPWSTQYAIYCVLDIGIDISIMTKWTNCFQWFVCTHIHIRQGSLILQMKGDVNIIWKVGKRNQWPSDEVKTISHPLVDAGCKKSATLWWARGERSKSQSGGQVGNNSANLW